MKMIVLVGSMVAMMAVSGPQAGPPDTLVLKGGVIRANLKGDALFAKCAVVKANGRWHLEVRRQGKSGAKAEILVFDGVLSKEKFNDLRNTLAKEDVASLPRFYGPTTSLSSSHYEIADFTVPRDGRDYRLGYIYVPEKYEKLSGQKESKATVDEWNQSRLGLQKLVEWIDEAPVDRLHLSTRPANSCTE